MQVREESRAAAATLPPPDRVKGALLGPIKRPIDKSFQFEAETGGISLELLRSRRGVISSRNQVEEPGPAFSGDLHHVHGQTLYAGPLIPHFGHMVADGVHRLWGALLPGMEQVPVLFHIGPHAPPQMPPWLLELLSLFGIAPERIIFNDRPTRYEELIVPRQGRAHAGGVLLENYLDLFPLNPIAPVEGEQAPLYVSRRQHLHTGSYLGEGLVEATLAKAGFDIVYPELQSIGALVGKLVRARTIVFCEGSAIHNVELTGRLDARVFVIMRRSAAKPLVELLRTVCDASMMFGAGLDSFTLDWDRRKNEPHGVQVCALVDVAEMLRALADFSGIAIPVPGAAAIGQAMALDLLHHMLHASSGASSSDEQLGRALRRMRDVPHVQDLFRFTAPAAA